MNPVAARLEDTDLPPLDDVRANLRIPWYRCPIDRDTLSALNEPSDLRGAVQALGHLLLWLMTGATAFVLFQQQQWWAFALALFAHGTVTSHFTAPHHELCHTTVFRARRANEAFLRLYSLLGWLNPHVYRFSHSYHHRYTLYLEGDREEVMPARPSLAPLYLLQLFTLNITGGYQSRGVIPTVANTLALARGRLDRPFNSWGPELYHGHGKAAARAVRWARIVLGFHAGVIVLAFATGQPIVALLVSGASFIANAHRYFVGVPMHCGLRSDVPDFRKCVRSIRLDPVSEFLYWHMNWHLEHHMYAAVPCYRLKALHNVLAQDMPAPRSLVGAWREMRTVWRRQQHEPDHAFDTPVPNRSAAGTSEDATLAASLGGLAPAELSVGTHSRAVPSTGAPPRATAR